MWLFKFLILTLFIAEYSASPLLGEILAPVLKPKSMVPNDPDLIKFRLYSDPENKKKNENLGFKSKKKLDGSNFKKDKKVVFIVHGFWSDMTTEVPKFVKDAYLESDLNYNYIVVDWSVLSRSEESDSKLISAFRDNAYPVVYPIVVKKSIPIVAQRIADFIQFLVDKEYTTLEDIHIVGHSLGAHTSGMAGHLVKKANKGKKVKRVTGLDPAGPLFDNHKSIREQRPIDKDDGEFVDIYHTAMGTRGYEGPIPGHVEFYPNGGVDQPACPKESKMKDLFGAGHCPHMYIAQIYAATIKGDVKACKCTYTWTDDKLKTCLKECPDEILAGEKCPPEATGEYYFEFDEKLQLP